MGRYSKAFSIKKQFQSPNCQRCQGQSRTMKKIIFLELFLRIIEDEKWNLFEKLGQLRTPTLHLTLMVLSSKKETMMGMRLGLTPFWTNLVIPRLGHMRQKACFQSTYVTRTPIVHFGIILGSPTSILHPLCTSHGTPLSAYFTSPRKKAAGKDTRTRKKSGKNHETNPD